MPPISPKLFHILCINQLIEDEFLAEIKTTCHVLDPPEDLQRMLELSRSHRELCWPGTPTRYNLEKGLQDHVNAHGLQLACLFTKKCLSGLDCLLATSLPSLGTITIISRNAKVTRKLFLAWQRKCSTYFNQLLTQTINNCAKSNFFYEKIAKIYNGFYPPTNQ